MQFKHDIFLRRSVFRMRADNIRPYDITAFICMGGYHPPANPRFKNQNIVYSQTKWKRVTFHPIFGKSI